MKRWRIAAIAGGTVIGLGAAAAIAGAVGSHRFLRRYEDEKSALLARAKTVVPAVKLPALTDSDLPAPVRRYLALITPEAGVGLRSALVRQRGELRASATQRWMPFVSEQVYTLDPPGFLWHAKARIAPGIHMLARDKFVDGKGNMWITVLGVVGIANATGPGVDSGAGLRYWGEALVFPEVVLSRQLRWEAVNERSARVHIRQDSLHLTGLVEFDEQGYLESIHANRHRDVDGVPVLTPWSGHMQRWKTVGGRAFPTIWTSVWHLAEGDLTAVRMEIEDLATD
ncbi:MAG TPA: DUF6544 family protein [Polyangia bacterium]